MSAESAFVLLFSISTAVAIAVRRVRVPYTVALVLVGLALGSLRLVEAPHLTQELLFAIILPGLLFEAAFNLDMREFWANRMAIGALAVPGVVAAIALTAAIVAPILVGLGLDPSFDWRYGLVFGSLIAATDPIAVVALFKQLNVGHRLSTVVEGESLLNDGTSVVLFTIILSFVSGAVTTPASLVADFVTITGGGALAGALVGVVATQATKRIDDPLIEIALTVIAAYGSFVLAEQLHVSGVIATVTAGMLCGTYGWRVGMSPSTKLAVDSFWDYVAFALNSMVFLLIGFEVRLSSLAGSWALIAVAYLGALLARLAVVLAVAVVLRRTRERLPRGWAPVLTWGGLRGALSMVLALALPAGFPHREQLVVMTFGVVLLSLVVQGLTMARLLHRFGLVHVTPGLVEHEQARAELRAVDVAVRELDRLRRQHAAPPFALDAMEQRLEARRAEARRVLESLSAGESTVRRGESVRAVRRILLAERAELAEMRDDGMMSREALSRLADDLDLRLARLDAGEFAEPEELLAGRGAPASR
jgi:CPA1 family monovalent cation:H+ antiporter